MTPTRKKVLIAWACFAVIAAFAQSRGWLRPVEQKGVLLYLTHTARSMNQDLPKSAGDGVQLDLVDAGVDGDHLFLRQSFTLLEIPMAQANVNDIRQSIFPGLRDAYCKSPAAKSNPFFTLVYVYDYFTSDRQRVTEFQFKPSDCADAAPSAAGS